jgi:hypothetical protein
MTQFLKSFLSLPHSRQIISRQMEGRNEGRKEETEEREGGREEREGRKRKMYTYADTHRFCFFGAFLLLQSSKMNKEMFV